MAGDFAVGLQVTSTSGATGSVTRPIAIRLAPPPGPVGVSINDGAQFTNDPNVRIFLRWPALTSNVTVSDDGGFAHSRTVAVFPAVPWKLDSSGPERLPKTVYVRFDGSTQTFQDDIILDETAPVVQQATVTAAVGGTAQKAAIVSARKRRFIVATRAKDNVSGVARMQITSNRRKPRAALRYRAKAPFKTSAKVIYVRVRDRAGNWSRWRTAKSHK